MSKFINTQKLIEEYKIIKVNEEFPTLYDYALYVCGGDFTSFDNTNLLAIEIHQDEQNKGIPVI